MKALLLGAMVVGCSGCAVTLLPLAGGVATSVTHRFHTRIDLARRPDTRRIGPCLDVSLSRYEPRMDDRSDAAATLALRWNLGNACDAPQTLDLAAARVWAVDGAGVWRRVTPFDPRSELQATRIEPAIEASAVIGYVQPPDETRVTQMAVRLCVDVSHVTDGATLPSAAPLCVRIAADTATDDAS